MLTRQHSVLCVIDMQRSLFRVMDDQESLLNHTLILVKGAQILGVPIIVTEQVKLGDTLEEIASLLPGGSESSRRSFSCLDQPSFLERLRNLHRPQVILSGIESHICVYQTAMGLRNAGYEVLIAEDCLASRRRRDKETALRRMIHEGIHPTTAEMALFELLKTAADPQAREIFRLVK